MSHRKMTPKGHMSSNGSGPAIMMMPNHVRATFMPGPPLKFYPPPKKGGFSRRPALHGGNVNSVVVEKEGAPVRRSSLTGVTDLLVQFERTAPPKRVVGATPASARVARARRRVLRNTERLAPSIERYRERQKETPGEFDGMNCYNTLFVGRLAYETTERKLLREFEAYGPVKDVKLVWRRDGTEDDDVGAGGASDRPRTTSKESVGYAFVEFEQEEDMKRAYRGADATKLDARNIVVDVERGHTVPNWLPRRLGGGLGGTRLGGKDKNIAAPGRFDPSKDTHPPPNPNHHPPHPMSNRYHGGGGPGGPMMPGGPDRHFNGGGRPGDYPPRGGGGGDYPPRGGPPPPFRGGPPGPHGRGGGPGGGYGGGGPPPGYFGRGGPPPPDAGRYGPSDRERDRYGGGGGGPPGRYGPPPPGRGRYDDRGPPPRGGGPYGPSDGKRGRSRSRSRSPPSRRRRYRG